MNRKLLQQIGWSKELIDAAEEVKRLLPEAIKSPVDGHSVNFHPWLTQAGTEIDLSDEQPVGSTELLILK